MYNEHMTCLSCFFYMDNGWGVGCILSGTPYDERRNAMKHGRRPLCLSHEDAAMLHPCDCAINDDALIQLLKNRGNTDGN